YFLDCRREISECVGEIRRGDAARRFADRDAALRPPHAGQLIVELHRFWHRGVLLTPKFSGPRSGSTAIAGRAQSSQIIDRRRLTSESSQLPFDSPDLLTLLATMGSR